MSDQLVSYELNDGIATITIDDGKRNALPPAMFKEIYAAFDKAEAEAFINQPHAEDAVRLRRWDDLAKVPNMATPSLEHFQTHIEQVFVGTTA